LRKENLVIKKIKTNFQLKENMTDIDHKLEILCDLMVDVYGTLKAYRISKANFLRRNKG
jgi:hypothetical protein